MNFINYFKKNWGIIAGFTLFIFGILSTFLANPPNYIANEQTFANWGKWVAAIIIALILVATTIYKSREDTKKWWLTAVIMLILSAVSFFSYQYLLQKWTCFCFDETKLILIGSELLNPDNEFVRENRNDCQILLQGGSCSAERVWTKSSIDSNRLILAGVFTLSLPFLITAMMAVVMALFCSTRRSHRNAPANDV